MKVDLGLDVSCLFSRVEEGLREIDAIVQIVGAPPPFPPAGTPSSLLWARVSGLGVLIAAESASGPVPPGVTPASHQLAHTAGPSHAVRYASRRDGVSERRLAET